MYCCNNCKDCGDYLDIPAGAIIDDDQYEVTQQFPFICRQNECKSNYRVLCVKEYNEIKNRTFQKHVHIVAHFISEPVLDYSKMRIRYSKGNKIYIIEPSSNDSLEYRLPDLYFTVNDNKVTLFTKHFTEFYYEEENRSFLAKIIPSYSKCKTREVELVAQAYYMVHETEKKVFLNVYIRDIKLQNEETIKNCTDCSEKEDGYTCYFDKKGLINLPEIIKKSTLFQCILFTNRSRWQNTFDQMVTYYFMFL